MKMKYDVWKIYYVNSCIVKIRYGMLLNAMFVSFHWNFKLTISKKVSVDKRFLENETYYFFKLDFCYIVVYNIIYSKIYVYVCYNIFLLTLIIFASKFSWLVLKLYMWYNYKYSFG